MVRRMKSLDGLPGRSHQDHVAKHYTNIIHLKRIEKNLAGIICLIE